MKMKKFEIGQVYDTVDWFTGGTCVRKVKDRTDTSLIFEIQRHELDGDHKGVEEYDIYIDEDGNEYVLLYSYKGSENRITAGYDAWGK